MGHSTLSDGWRLGKLNIILLNIFAYTVALLPSFYLFQLSSSSPSPSTFFIPDLSSPLFPIHFMLLSNLSTTLVIFLFSFLLNNSSMFDAYWSVIPPLNYLFFCYLASLSPSAPLPSFQPSPPSSLSRSSLQGTVIFLWAIRLTYNCFHRWNDFREEDWRYHSFRKHGPLLYWGVSLLGFHVVPCLTVFAGCISISTALLVASLPLGSLDYLALAVGLMAVLVQHAADSRMNLFIRERERLGDKAKKILDSGVWAYSRHPNYFGEISFWISNFIFAVASTGGDFSSTEMRLSVLGPLVIIFLFTVISIPLMEKRSFEKRPGYAEYAKKTPVLIPFLF